MSETLLTPRPRPIYRFAAVPFFAIYHFPVFRAPFRGYTILPLPLSRPNYRFTIFTIFTIRFTIFYHFPAFRALFLVFDHFTKAEKLTVLRGD